MYPPVQLDKQVPSNFGVWRVDASLVPVLPDPSVQARLDQIYNQVLARTYIDNRGRRVMLSIAYGADQGSDSTAVHRPEFCYAAQGFTVQARGEDQIRIEGSTLRVKRLVGTLAGRIEPITYWVTLNDRATLPGLDRKLQQIALGLRGQIPDGLLLRVSTLGLPTTEAFTLQDEFVLALRQSMPAALRPRYFGRVNI